MPARVVVAIGTRKGLFVLESKGAGKPALRGPFFPGIPVNAALIDRRGRTPRVLTAPSSPWFGTTIQVSRDLGRKWKATKSAPAFKKDDGRTLKNIWSLAAGRDGNDSYLCGLEPAALFESKDGGDRWTKVPGITDHPHAAKWQPGAGGLCMHTILHHGGALHVGISTGGHYASRDRGKTFAPENHGIGVGFQPDKFPAYGQCVHKIAAHPSRPERLYIQNHGGFPDVPGVGVLRSDDGGRSWRQISKGLPSDFGFPMVVHPDDGDTIYVAPLEPMTRGCPDGKPAIWRSEDAGGSWSRLARGLPPKAAWFTILRDAMDADDSTRPSIWFGTTTGQLWRGREGGEKWECVEASLPPIHCVKAAAV